MTPRPTVAEPSKDELVERLEAAGHDMIVAAERVHDLAGRLEAAAQELRRADARYTGCFTKARLAGFEGSRLPQCGGIARKWLTVIGSVARTVVAAGDRIPHRSTR